MTLFRDRYRVESTRLRGYDYSTHGWYFVTICTAQRECVLSTIRDSQAHLSAQGRVAERCWCEIPSHFSDVGLDAFVVMPNHVHGIVILRDTPQTAPASPYDESSFLGVVIGSYKAAVTRECHKSGLSVRWQSRFHERIIRGPRGLDAVRAYIADNPINWLEDEYAPPVPR